MFSVPNLFSNFAEYFNIQASEVKKTITIFFIALAMAFSNSIDAQRVGILIAKLDYEKTDGGSHVRGWFQNNQVLPAVFNYVFTVEKKDTLIIERNSFRASSGQRVNLSKAVFFFRKEEKIDRIKLEVLKYGKLVAADSIIIRTPKTRVSEKPSLFQKAPPKTNQFDDLEIDGLILDETRSKIGHDFYEYFYTGWVAPKGARGYIITIREVPGRGRGAQISVEINDQIIAKRFLQPRADLIESNATQVIAIVKEHLSKMADLNNQILSEDVQGSGIY